MRKSWPRRYVVYESAFMDYNYTFTSSGSTEFQHIATMLLHLQRETNIRDATASKTAKKWSVPEAWSDLSLRVTNFSWWPSCCWWWRGKQCEQIASIRCPVPRWPGSSNRIYLPMPGIPTNYPPLLFVVFRLSALSSSARTAPASRRDITMGVCYVWRSSVCFTQCHFLSDIK